MIRLICVGLAGMGHHDWSSAAAVDEFALVAGVDPDAEAREAFTQATGNPTFEALEPALGSVAADAALIATPDAFHAPYSIRCLEHGLDVICEKPMAETLEDARSMHRAAETSGRMLMIHHQLRWSSPYARLRQVVAQGIIGTLRQVDLDMLVFSGACLVGYRSKLPHLILQDLAIHHFDLLRYVSGQECSTIYARAWPSNQEGVSISCDTSATAVLEMTGPVTASYRCRMRELLDPTGYAPRMTLIGSRGEARFADGTLAVQTYGDSGDGWGPREMVSPRDDGNPMVAFAEAMRTREPALTASGDNIKSLEVMFAAVRSAETGTPVRVGDASG